MSGGNREVRSFDAYICDDDPSVLEVLTSFMELRGVHVKAMTSGQDLIEAINQQPPRLVLLDVMMPVVNGYAVFSSIKSMTRAFGIHVYFISALPERNLAWYAKTNGADGYVTKPFSLKDIDAVLAATGIPTI
ncbi:MAG: response regulator [Candidatus Lokiarchaeota archaeon]|nr:response regulator [Candidatus Lokiarchaeota archaeon]